MKALLFAVILFVQFAAHALGGIEGGGGKGVVCTDASNNVTSVELLDLWEARTLFSQMPDKTLVAGGLADGVLKIMTILKQSYPYQGYQGDQYGNTICKDQDCVLYHMKGSADLFLQPGQSRVDRLTGVKLALTDDSYEVAQPDGNCDIRQIVNYGLGPDSKIYIDQDLFAKMDTLNQAALIAHESYYAFLRQVDNETNSIRTRRAVGYAASNQQFVAAPPVVLPSKTLRCVDTQDPNALPQTEIYFYPNATDPAGFSLWLHRFGGKAVIGIGSGESSFPASLGFNPFMTTTCTGDGRELAGISSAFPGPVEFDQGYVLRWACAGGQNVLYVNQHEAGSNQANTPMYCKMVQQ